MAKSKAGRRSAKSGTTSIQPLKSAVRSALRKVWSYYDPNRKAALAAAKRTRPRYNKDGSMSKTPRVVWICAHCKCDFELKEVQVDHITPIGETPEVPAASIDDWGKWFLKAFCAMSNLAILCKPCHLVKTKEERRVRSIRSKRASTKTRAKSRSRVA